MLVSIEIENGTVSAIQVVSIILTSILLLKFIIAWLPQYRNEMWIDSNRHPWASLFPTFLWLLVGVALLPVCAFYAYNGSMLLGGLASCYLLCDLIIIWIPWSGLCWRVSRTILHILGHTFGPICAHGSRGFHEMVKFGYESIMCIITV